ncbi:MULTISPECIES: ArsR family transcriptional regulator [Clostridia]|uniref:helix-turn-helix transcriptional regulator n=1 Tax=Clostridia TaxID=186801 RepID=UPI000EA3BE98|nr:MULTISPECIES: ArsR family transcriptional regulator [Clostridia]NBJ71157.1 ArsR family transcriptional regulator [Roseburia sp. 1XD42-34]RKI75084.1 ArsR family transcriptional regulator [Clostridium sp. 1xD42-85]
MKRKTTKDKILYLLKKEGKLTVGDFIQHLQITDMAIRKHLSTMEKEGLISSVEMKQPIGRPIQQYILSVKGERLFPKNYETLSIEFLNDIQTIYGDKAIQQLFDKRKQRLSKEYAVHLQHKSPEEKMRELKRLQNEKGYMAEYKQTGAKTYELVEHNCPLLAIAQSFKIACHCETATFQSVLETEQIKRISCKTEGNDHCRFSIIFS